MALHPDQLGEPDEHGRITIGVRDWLGPDPAIPGYARSRVYLSHLGRPPRLVVYEPRGNLEGARRAKSSRRSV